MSDTIEKVKTEEEDTLKLTFKKPVKWEDHEYKEIDLSGLDNLTGRQLSEIYKEFGKLGVVAAVPTQNPDFAAIAASKATGMPVEFFRDLPGKELFKLTNIIFAYFFTED